MFWVLGNRSYDSLGNEGCQQPPDCVGVGDWVGPVGGLVAEGYHGSVRACLSGMAAAVCAAAGWAWWNGTGRFPFHHGGKDRGCRSVASGTDIWNVVSPGKSLQNCWYLDGGATGELSLDAFFHGVLLYRDLFLRGWFAAIRVVRVPEGN